MSYSIDLSGRVAFITGASSGLGRGLALWFARRGAQVWAAARRMDALRGLEADASAGPGGVIPVQLDVEDVAAVQAKMAAADDAAKGGIDLVIANAGVGGETPARCLDWPVVQRMLQVNVFGAAATLSTLLPRMVERNAGHLVGMSSLAAWAILPGMGTYGATKAFLATFCQGLRVDLRSTGVTVGSIHPGFVKSEMTAGNSHRMPFLLETEDAVERMGKSILRRDAEFAFPWPMALGARAARFLPETWISRAGGR